MMEEPAKAEIVESLTGEPPATYTAGKQIAPAPQVDPIIQGVTDILAEMIQVAKDKFQDKKAVKRLSIPELIEQIATLIKAVKTNKIILPPGAEKDLHTIRTYADGMNAADSGQRKEARSELRTKLKRRPQ